MRVESPHRFTKAASVLALAGAAFLGGTAEAHSQVPSSPVRQCESITGDGYTDPGEGLTTSKKGEPFIIIQRPSWENGCLTILIPAGSEIGGIDPGETIRR